MSPTSPLLRRAASAAAALGVVLMAGCSQADPLPTDPMPLGAEASVGATSYIPGPGLLLVPGSEVGSFANSVVPDNSGRETTEFWDNYSADWKDLSPASSPNVCNMGNVAIGLGDASTCRNTSAASVFFSSTEYAGAKYWGDGTGNRDASAFMFKGGYEYTITFRARIAPREHVVGYFTKSGGTYTYVPFTITEGQSTTFTPTGDWGLYVKVNAEANTDDGGCGTDGGSQIHCSDAEGGWRGLPGNGKKFQHLALFVNSTETKYLVGIETGKVKGPLQCSLNSCGIEIGETVDADYNDLFYEIIPSEVEDEEEPMDGRFTGGGVWTQVPSYGKVTLGFTLHCDNLLTNNLQITWLKQKWHIVKNSLDPVTCTKPGNPVPPVAPVNRIVATAEGRYFDGKKWIDGVYTDFILVDNGEPSAKSKNSGGTNKDQIALRIYKGGTTYLVVGSTGTPTLVDIRGGNIQAHYDQPHGQKP